MGQRSKHTAAASLEPPGWRAVPHRTHLGRQSSRVAACASDRSGVTPSSTTTTACRACCGVSCSWARVAATALQRCVGSSSRGGAAAARLAPRVASGAAARGHCSTGGAGRQFGQRERGNMTAKSFDKPHSCRTQQPAVLAWTWASYCAPSSCCALVAAANSSASSTKSTSETAGLPRPVCCSRAVWNTCRQDGPAQRRWPMCPGHNRRHLALNVPSHLRLLVRLGDRRRQCGL